MSNASPTFLADGNINPSVFVTMTGVTGDNRVAQATANQKIAGISQEWSKGPPTSGNSTLAAASGDAITVYGPGEQCLLSYAYDITRGQLLKSDANGQGMPITGTTAQNYGAQALENGASGELHNVRVMLGTTTAPAS